MEYKRCCPVCGCDVLCYPGEVWMCPICDLDFDREDLGVVLGEPVVPIPFGMEKQF